MLDHFIHDPVITKVAFIEDRFLVMDSCNYYACADFQKIYCRNSRIVPILPYVVVGNVTFKDRRTFDTANSISYRPAIFCDITLPARISWSFLAVIFAAGLSRMERCQNSGGNDDCRCGKRASFVEVAKCYTANLYCLILSICFLQARLLTIYVVDFKFLSLYLCTLQDQQRYIVGT